MDFGKIAILSQKLEFLSQSKIWKNKSPAPALHSYELTTATTLLFSATATTAADCLVLFSQSGSGTYFFQSLM